jgi:hypothetical protein
MYHVVIHRQVGQHELALACLVKGRTLSIGVGMIENGSTITRRDIGTLVIARWRAAELGLLDSVQP